MTQTKIENLNLFVKAILDRKAHDLIILDISRLTSIADAFIICSGKSSRQVTAIADYIQSELRDHGIKPLHVEGKTEGLWVLMDYGHVVIHIFFESTRHFFDLEGLWTEARKIAPEKVLEEEAL